MQNQVQHTLKNFKPITLKEMDGVKLMDRIDTKFCFNVKHLNDILNKIEKNYSCLLIENNNYCNYNTLYFDTHEFDLYNAHHNGKLNRFKIRHRTYVESNLQYLEIKHKTNKGRTIKTRIKSPLVDETIASSATQFVSEKLPYSVTELKPNIWVNYKRITLVNKFQPERVTLDLNLEFLKNKNAKNLDYLVIAEIKQGSKTQSPFIEEMNNLRIKEGGMSKYCLAVALCQPGVKINNFKEKIRTIQKIK